VEVAVAERVATVELMLDGELAGRLSGEPWKTEIDLGTGLMTHELVAVARDRACTELGRAVQQLNVPRSPAEVEILLDGWRGGRPRYARLIWHSRQLVEPESITVALDGTVLEFGDPEQIELPVVDPQSLHFISAELVFPGNHRSVAQSIFGGRYGEEVESELTAVPVLLDRRRLERPEEARGWVERPGGAALRVVAVEDDAAQLFIVRDDAALPVLRRLDAALKADHGNGYRRLGLEVDDRLFLTSARAVVSKHPDLDYELYPISREIGLVEAPLPEVLTRFRVGGEVTTEQRLSDAVAVAGVRAAAGGKRRAVLLVVSHCGERSGHWTGEEVRRYLAELRVPLVVWTTVWPNPRNGGFCAGARHLINSESYGGALSRVRRLLKKQQILWVEGSHLPREVVLADSAPATEVVQPN